MIQSDKKIKEDKVVHFYNDAEPIEGCTKFYACIWFTDGSGMFYSYIYAKDCAGLSAKPFSILQLQNHSTTLRISLSARLNGKMNDPLALSRSHFGSRFSCYVNC